MRLKRGNGNIIEVEDILFAKGGQAGIHKIISPSYTVPLVAKLYFDGLANASQGGNNSKIDQLRRRLEYMVNNNPFFNAPNQVKEAFVWPVDTVFDLNNNFLGFLMSMVDNSISLTKITNERKLASKWDKFKISNSDSYNVRLKVCYNIAQALAEMHKSNTYTMVDFKPDNMMLKDNGLVRMIDMDSIQIAQKGRILFNAAVRTPEFSPPEDHLQKVDFSKDFIEQSWDCYSFGAIAYLTLLNIHPFQGLSHKTDKNITSFEEYLMKGYFPHGTRKNEVTIAPPHRNFSKLLSNDLQNLFIKCFEDGYKNPAKRPCMIDWRDALYQEIKNNQSKKVSGGINQPNPSKTPKAPRVHQPANNYPIYTPPPPRPTIPISTIASFLITPAGPNKARLTWTTTNTVSARLNNSNVPVNGSQIIPLANKTYVLEAYDNNGNHVSSTVNATFNLSIKKFNHRIIKNAIILEWDVYSATKVKINNVSKSSNGTMQIPLNIGTHTIEAEDSNGFKILDQLNIIILTQIEKFNLILNRSDAFIEWDTINATIIDINGHKVNPSGILQIPLKSNSFKLTAIDKSGNSTNKSLTANINPTIKKFDIVTYAHSAEITWDAWYAKECFLNGETVPMSGSKKVPIYTKDYMIEIVGSDGSKHTKIKSVKGNALTEITQTETVIKNSVSLTKVSGLKNDRIITETQIKVVGADVNIVINNGKITLKESGKLKSGKSNQLSGTISLKNVKSTSNNPQKKK